MKTEEVEALAKVYCEAAAEATAGGNCAVDARAAGVAAVARAVRAQDAARDGTLSEAQEADAIRLTLMGDRDAAEVLREHMAAQGRANAAKDARIAELEAKADRSENRRGWARSEALAANAAANTATTDMQSAWTRTAIAEQRATRAESALATLRQAVAKYANDMDAKAAESDRVETPPDARPYRVGSLTASIGYRASAAAARDILKMLGNSGPSGGGETATPTDWSKHAKGCTVEWTPTPSGPTPRVWTCAPDCPSKPTTPPYVAASEPTPTPEEDWRTVEDALDILPTGVLTTAERDVLSALARLKAEPRRAAEAMRERCAKVARDCQCAGDSPGWRAAQAEIEDIIRALPL